jgi:diguanylate cyclase (GGDEF)-like protein
MPVRRVSANDPVLPPVLAVTPQGIEIRNPASGWLLAAGAGLAAIAYATVAVSVWPPALNFEAVMLTVVLVLAAAVSGGMNFRAERNYLLSAPTLLYVTSAAVILGPLAAVLAGAFGGGRSIRWPRQARVYSAGLGGLEGGAAALVASSFDGAPSHLRLVVECGAVGLVGGLVWFAGQALVCIVRRLPSPALRLRRIDAPSTGAEVAVALAFGPPVILLYRNSGILPLVVFIGVLIAAFGLFLTYRARLLDLHAEVERLSRTDPLTGVLNRRAFDDRLDHELRRMSRTSHPFGLVLIDVDQFKQINDGYGHGVGDQVLTELSRRLRLRLRDEDLLSRIGGDEFAAIITNIDDAATLRTLDHDLHHMIAGSPFLVLHKQIHVTISVGVALAGNHSTTCDDLLNEADQALYRDKAHADSHACVTPAERLFAYR